MGFANECDVRILVLESSYGTIFMSLKLSAVELMENTCMNQKRLDDDTTLIFNPKPITLFFSLITIICIAEILVMLVIYLLGVHDLFYIGVVDAALLSLLVAPSLYLMFLKPMRETIERLDRSEFIQNELEEIDRLKSDLILVASQELYTPLSFIKGSAEILFDDKLEPRERHKHLELILYKIERLERVINDLGIVDNFETGDMLQIEFKKNDLVATIQEVCDIYRKRIPEISIHFTSSIETLNLKFDEARIKQVIDNLLSNSVKYSKGEQDVIEVSLIHRESEALITISDNGIGMTQKELEKIYKKYYRAKSTDSNIGGLGLGMTIVKKIIESHKGQIKVKSEKGIGTTITISLPIDL